MKKYLIKYFSIKDFLRMVNTFVINSNPEITACVLDDRRLGKQRIESFQIITSLEQKDSVGWKNHPITRSWDGYTNALKHYCNIMINEWVRRGKNNTMSLYKIDTLVIFPSWFINPKIHYSHMARLIQKDPIFYKDKFIYPPEYNNFGYIWPNKWTEEQLITLSVKELAEPYIYIPICTANTKTGSPCHNKALYDSFCGIHKSKDYTPKICKGTLKNGNPCRFKVKEGDYCKIHTTKTILP